MKVICSPKQVFYTAMALYMSYKRVQWKTDQMPDGTDAEQVLPVLSYFLPPPVASFKASIKVSQHA